MKRRKVRSKYQLSRIKTRAMKHKVPKDLLPLFNHCVRMAEHAHKSGYPKRAGLDLLHARRLAKYGDS